MWCKVGAPNPHVVQASAKKALAIWAGQLANCQKHNLDPMVLI